MNNKIEELEARITELESREGFHEDTIETLNKIIIEQNNEINKIKRIYQILWERLEKSHEDEPSAYQLEDEIPPHY